jgi:TldD protein
MKKPSAPELLTSVRAHHHQRPDSCLLTPVSCLLAICALLAPVAISAQENAGDNDVILKAMRDEMERSRQLRVVGGQDLPYFFAYDFTDSNNFRANASMGSAVEVSQAHLRFPSVEVRVGSYDFDNTGHVYSGIYSGSRYDQSWPLDDDYAALRESFWLATDRAYKAALESMGRKRASINGASAQTDKLPDFSKVEPVVNLPKVSHSKFDEEAWSARVKRLSSVFNGYPEVLTSQVEMQSVDGVTYYVTSEGTALRYADKVSWLMARAEGQATDGMYVRDALSVQALDAGKLPSEAEMHRSVTELAENVRALVKAPAGEAFTGPALFEPQAAAQLLAQLLGDNLRVPRRPLTDPGRNVNFVASELESRMGGRVLPDWMDVADDPTQSMWNGKPLIGFYTFDLEGVAPKPVKVIEKGLVKAFLTTRQPIRGFPESNGHARLGGAFGARGAAIANLFVTARESAPLADLKQRLIQLCQERGKPYGILVRKLDFPFSAGTGELQGLAQANQQSGGSARPVSPPLLVYRVYPDGREELVRGLRFRGVSTRSLRDVLAASRETALFDFVNNGAPLAMMSAGGYLAPSSVVAPGLLFDEIELDVPRDQLPKTPLVPSPSSGQ